MSKRLIVVLALALVVGLTMSAYAEVQNVKVSGDLAITGAARNNFDLVRKSKTGPSEDHENMWLSQLRVRLDADLTDNVAATVRLINERNWDTESNANTDIDVDLAYVTLKEFLYSPLALTLGRQEIRFGNALIMGNARTAAANVYNGVPSDLSLRKAFDALRATLNYDPLVIDAFYAKINESNDKNNDDIDLFGINAAYDFNKKLRAEAYFYDSINHGNAGSGRYNIKTLGALISGSPINDLKTSLEAAMQFGSQEMTNEKRQKAWALQAMADYTFSKVKFTPALGASYTYLSGDGNNSDKTNKNWNRMFYDQALNNIAYVILPFSNMQVYNLRGSAKPTEDISLILNYGFYRRNKDTSSMTSVNVDGAGSTYLYTMTDKNYLGYELDLSGTYNYTEDVQFGLTLGYFKPGKAFGEMNRRTATQAVGSIKVIF